MIPFVIEMRGQAQVSRKQTTQNQQQTLKLQAPTSRGNRSQVSDCTVVQRISQLCGICASVQNSNFSGPLTVHDLLNQSSVYRGGSSPRSVKMYWLSQEVQCFRVDPINKQNHNAGRSKINT